MNINSKIINYNKKGFVILRSFFSKNEIAKLMQDLEAVKYKVLKSKSKNYYHKTKDGKFNTIHDIQNFIKSGSIIRMTKKKTLKNLVEKILKDKSVLRNIEFFLKPKKTGMASPFHQDNFYWNIISAKALNVWVACSTANMSNGGLCYLEGSHKLGTIKHVTSFQKGSSQKIPEQLVSKLNFKKIYPNLKTGDCIIHHPEVIHGSKKNNSNKDRVGFVVSFKGKNSKIDNSRLEIYKQNLKNNLETIYKNNKG
tara:strand:- start:640 stop:1398 length:759 start_codon:yes stop_codon:yes gene_type:complete